MMKRTVAYFTIVILWTLNICSAQQAAGKLDWEQFMHRQDIVWDKLPGSLRDAPFLGNGMMGVYLHKDSLENAIHFEIGRSDVHDHRTGKNGDYERPRLMIGYFEMYPKGKITGAHWRLDLWNAEVTGSVVTDQGEIKIRCLVHADKMLVLVEAEGTGMEKKVTWKWVPAKADSPRQLYGIMMKQAFRINNNYISNPDPVIDNTGTINTCTQPLLNGGQTVTAWKENTTGLKSTLFITVAHSFPYNNAKAEATKTIQALYSLPVGTLVASHQQWWHQYYPASFLSLPDKKMESFYWVQMYKLASATRGDRALIDCTGPWLTLTPWPNAWWNLNIQLTYWPVYASNRVNLGESLSKTLFSNTQNLINNVKEEYRNNSAGVGRNTAFDCVAPVGVPGDDPKNEPEVGLLTWTCHNLWLQYRSTMDDKMLRNNIYPLLKRAINYYIHFLKTGADGRLHLPTTYSPEYGSAEDCNFDISLIRWGCTTLLNAAERLKINDSLIPVWKNILDKLTDYPTDANGYRIGSNMPYAISHRHGSHLIMAYPLYLVNKDNNETPIIKKSMDYWLSKKEKLRGFSYTWASSLASAIGNGDSALKYFKLFANFLQPNTLYFESGPVIETPLSGAQNIHDMLMQSWGNKIRVFPAVPGTWKNVTFDRLRAEGAFLVSAKRKEGKTNWIKIKSLAGEPCIIKTDLVDPVIYGVSGSMHITKAGAGEYMVALKKGEEVILYAAGTKPDLSVEAVPE